MCIRDSYKNIVETIDGEMIVGDLEGEFEEGHVLIAAANPDMMEGYIEPQDMVILGNRYESQLCAIEMDAQCIVCLLYTSWLIVYGMRFLIMT